MFKAIRNCNDAQLSLQLSDVSNSLLVDHLESCNFMVHILEFLSELSHLVTNSGDKPIGCSPEGGTDLWVESKEWVKHEDAYSQSWRDQGVVVSLEFNEAGESSFFIRAFFDAGSKGEWEGGSDRRHCDFLDGSLLGG
jgi:hypothetical protein